MEATSITFYLVGLLIDISSLFSCGGQGLSTTVFYDRVWAAGAHDLLARSVNMWFAVALDHLAVGGAPSSTLSCP